ncbi:MAG: hypothetical protein ACRD3W_26365 [Terriglobales bacterium]
MSKEDIRRIEGTFEMPTEVVLTFNGKEVYNQLLPAGPYCLKLAGIVPRETGTLTVSFNGEKLFEMDLVNGE